MHDFNIWHTLLTIVVVFGVLIAVLVVRPMGLFGERVAERM